MVEDGPRVAVNVLEVEDSRDPHAKVAKVHGQRKG